jgi:REP element-mobilizing transposase RayT
MSAPKAYLLTWTTYGTWVAGDARGSVDARHNVYGTALAPVAPGRAAALAARLVRPPVRLDARMRPVVERAITDHGEMHDWVVLALNVRSNHVHVVVNTGDTPPRAALAQLKSWATRRLRAAGLVDADTPVWTARGSTRYLWTAEDVRQAATYVIDYQGDDLPALPNEEG